jgi:hypothetical protein
LITSSLKISEGDRKMLHAISSEPHAHAIIHKVKWSAEEDANLVRAVSKYGANSWVRIAMAVPDRTSKQCRERWLGQLSPSVLKANWTNDEDRRLLSEHNVHGNQWAVIAQSLPGRSSISVKNRWNWLLRHGIPQRFSEIAFPRTADPAAVADVTEQPRRTNPLALDALLVQDDLFGANFRKFQVKMLTGSAPEVH